MAGYQLLRNEDGGPIKAWIRGAAVLDETPAAQKPFDKVREAQRDLVEVLHELRQVVCVEG